MHHRQQRIASAIGAISLVLLVAGCAQAGQTGGSTTPSSGTPAERYVACLNDHGVDAIVGADGKVMLGAAGNGSGQADQSGQADETGGADQSGQAGADGKITAPDSDAGSGAVSEAEAACHDAVPNYEEPDDDTR